MTGSTRPSLRPKRALDDANKAARRAAILDEARRLFREDSRQLPSVASIAQACGLAKGTMYLYFRSREEIFISLLGDEFRGLFAELAQAFAAPQLEPEDVIQRFVAYLDQHPEFLRLDAMAYSILEHKLADEHMREFKLGVTRGLVAGGRLLEARQGLPPGRGVQVLLRTYALTRGLWQWLDFPPALLGVLSDPEFAPIRPDFRTELIAALREYWQGALLAI